MITKEQAEKLHYGQNLYFLDKEGKRILKCRVSGKIKTWKKRPDWRIPVKYGLYENAYIGTSGADVFCENPERFFLSEAELEIYLAPQVKGRVGTKKQIKSLNNLLTL